MIPARSRRVELGGFAVEVTDDQPTFWDRVEAGTWEPATIAAVGRLAGPDTMFLDLGAWVGALSLYAAALGARVLAVEADPVALEQLRRNLLANPALAARIDVLPKAVAPRAGAVRLGARRKRGDSMSSTLLAGSGTSWSAEAVTPEALMVLAEEGRRLVVKLDIEGGEYGLLPTLAPALARRDAVLLASFHPVILRESRDPDPDATGRAAFAALAGWRATPIGADEPAPAWSDPDAHGALRHLAVRAAVTALCLLGRGGFGH